MSVKFDQMLHKFTLKTKSAVLLGFLLVMLLLVGGVLALNYWVAGMALPDEQSMDAFRESYKQFIWAPVVILCLISYSLYWLFMRSYVIKPYESIQKSFDCYLVDRNMPNLFARSVNVECNRLSRTIDGLLSTINYADALVANRESNTDQFYDKVSGIKEMMGGQGGVDYDKEIEKYGPEKRINIVNHLALAMSLDNVQLVFLPQINNKNNNTEAVDALVRWDDPALHNMDPLIFLAIAEECGLIDKVTDITVELVCHAIKYWQHEGRAPRYVSINISSSQFYAPDLAYRIIDICAQQNVNPDVLEFEVSEAIFKESLSRAYQVCTELRDIGVRIVIDHYTGKHLGSYDFNRLKVSKIKLDRKFSSVELDAQEQKAIDELLGMSAEMGVMIVVTGIENVEQDRKWRTLDNPVLLQGFYYGHPSDRERTAISVSDQQA